MTVFTRRSPLPLVALVLAAAACSPTLDWRAVPVPDTELEAQLPCRPGRFEREVVVAGVALQLFMLSCEAGGVTYGVANADVGDPVRVEPVLEDLAAAARRTLRAARVDAVPFDLPGATPFRGNAGLRLRGVRPDGRAEEESLRVFARGTRVFQASAIGQSLPAAALVPFEEGLRFALEKR